MSACRGLLANKGGDPNAVAVLGLFGDGDLVNGECPPLTDDVGAEPSPRLRAFVELFGDRGVAGSVDGIHLEKYAAQPRVRQLFGRNCALGAAHEQRVGQKQV